LKISQQNAQLKYKNFFKQNVPKNTREYEDKIYGKNIGKKLMEDPKPSEKSDPNPKKSFRIYNIGSMIV
jgi:hypothetical protein